MSICKQLITYYLPKPGSGGKHEITTQTNELVK